MLCSVLAPKSAKMLGFSSIFHIPGKHKYTLFQMNTPEQVIHVDDAMRIFEEIRQELLKEGKVVMFSFFFIQY